jgi:hypothetical protein
MASQNEKKEPRKLFKIPSQITKDNFEETMHQAIALELATIPTYLSTYYSINRAQDQDSLYQQLLTQLPAGSEALAQELTLDVLVYANQAAALIMSVVIEEMLHLALSSNVKHAICEKPPQLVEIAKGISFPTQLDGHRPEFPINIDKLSLEQMTIFLQIESPNTFVDPAQKEPDTPGTPVDYTTIGKFYDMIIAFVKENYPGPYKKVPQLLPDQPFYSQNSINTVYYDRDHKPQFGSEDDSGGLVHVTDWQSAKAAMEEIIHQGEGRVHEDEKYKKLEFDKNGLPIPLPVKNGKVQFQSGDFDDKKKKELSHFDKFMESYSLGSYYKEKFDGYGLHFFDYFVYNQMTNPKQTDYEFEDKYPELAKVSEMGNAIFTYIILMVETCYHKDQDTQFKVFMYGIHKSMIWLLSDFGNSINAYTFEKDGNTYAGSLTFEYYDFSQSEESPKQQMITMANELAKLDSSWEWLVTDEAYLLALPDVSLDHKVAPDVPHIPHEKPDPKKGHYTKPTKSQHPTKGGRKYHV